MPLLLPRVILSVSLLFALFSTTNSQEQAPSIDKNSKEVIITPIIKVLPNPNLGNFIISSDHQIQEIKIYDLIGTLVQKTTVNATDLRINSNQLSHGIYVVHLTIDKEDWVRKIVVH